MAELTITNARLRAQQDLVNIGIDDGLIGQIGPVGPEEGATIDADGGLVTEGALLGCHLLWMMTMRARNGSTTRSPSMGEWG